MKHLSAVEPLEHRIAPAVSIVNALPDLVAGVGQTGATIDLATMVDGSATYHTFVEFTTNLLLPGAEGPAKIVLELFDDKAPLTVQNFLSYVNGRNGANYDGTFFHRIFDFGNDGQTDIIQAGGFDVTNLTKHIPTGPLLHNEYNGSDPSLLNLPGTIATAKTAVSPDTATSEWFINLSDNSTTLGGDNNGGYTVFGRITAGFDVAQAIGAAHKVNLGGVLTDLPVQDGYDRGTPSASDLIQIVDAKVLPASEASANGHTFSDVHVSEAGSNTPSLLLKATIQNDQLKLTYTPGATGVADVSVAVQKDGETVIETFTVTIKPNLITELTTHNLPNTFVPGDTGVAKVKLTNNTGGIAKGNVEVRLYLSQVDADGNGQLDPDAFLVDDGDMLLATKQMSLNLKSGKSLTVPVKFTVADTHDDIVLLAGKQYVVVTKVVPVSGGGIDELFTDDNSDARRSGHNASLSFGAVGGRSNVPLTLSGPNGPLTFTLTGGGTGSVTIDDDGRIDLAVNGTNAASVLGVKTATAGHVLDDVALNSTIGFVKLPGIGVNGNFTAGGGAKSIVLGNLGDPSANVDKDFSVNAFPIATQKLSLSLGAVNDYSFSSIMPVGKFVAQTWEDDEALTGPNRIFAIGLDTLRIAGNLEANVNIAGGTRVNEFSVGGTLHNSVVKALGDIGAIKLGSILSSAIYAGVTDKPDELTDLANGRNIGTFSVTGTFSNSVVAAASIKSVVLNAVDTAADAEANGFYADAIKSYVRKGLPGIRLTNLDAAGHFDQAGTYEVALF